MSQWAVYPTDQFQTAPAEMIDSLSSGYQERSRLGSLLFVPPLIGAGISWMCGGASTLTDFSFLLFTVVCLVLLGMELHMMLRRWGIGGLTLYGGCLVWFCYDYIAHWLNASSSYVALTGLDFQTLAKAAFYTILYVFCMSIGLNIRSPRWPEKLLLKTPELKSSAMQLCLVVAICLIGISPFFLFTAEPFYVAIYHQFLAGRGGIGPRWTVGRSGNVNYNFGGYVAQILQVGSGGSVYAILYAVLLAKNIFQKSVSWTIWLLWLLLGIGTGTRGDVVASMLPLLAAIFLKYQSAATMYVRRIRLRTYVLAFVTLLFMLLIVQFQITYRTHGFSGATVSDISTNISGNAMYSESLLAFKLIPDKSNYFYNAYDVEGILRAMPDQVYWFIVSPMPRALWTSKPIDPAWAWYNKVVAHEANGTEGTTVATGASAGWYIRYGPAGVIEGGLFVGWLMGFGERLLRHCSGRLNLLLFVLGWETWLFRSFRGFGYIDVDALFVAFIPLCVLVIFLNLFSGESPQPELA